MYNRRSFGRWIVAVGAAAACALALDAAVVLAGTTTRPTTQPQMGQAPTTGPIFIGGSINNDYARPAATPRTPPMLQSTPNGGDSAPGPGTVVVGGGITAGQVIKPSNTGVVPATGIPATPRPAAPTSQPTSTR